MRKLEFLMILTLMVFGAACPSSTSDKSVSDDENIATQDDDCLLTDDCEEESEDVTSETTEPEDTGGPAATEPKKVKNVKIKTTKAKNGVVGEEYVQEITAKYGSGKYNWSITDGKPEFEIVDENKDDDVAKIVAKKPTVGEKTVSVTVADRADAANTATAKYKFNIVDFIAVNTYFFKMTDSHMTSENVVEVGKKLDDETLIPVQDKESAVKAFTLAAGSTPDKPIIPKVETRGGIWLRFNAVGHGKEYTWSSEKKFLFDMYHPVVTENGKDRIDTSVIYLWLKKPFSATDIDHGIVKFAVEDELKSAAEVTISSLKVIGNPCEAAHKELKLTVDNEYTIDNKFNVTLKAEGGLPKKDKNEKLQYQWNFSDSDRNNVNCHLTNRQTSSKSETVTYNCALDKPELNKCNETVITPKFAAKVSDSCHNWKKHEFSDYTARFPSSMTIQLLEAKFAAKDVAHIQNTYIDVVLMKGALKLATSVANLTALSYDADTVRESIEFFWEENDENPGTSNILLSEADSVIIETKDFLCSDCSPLRADIQWVELGNENCHLIWNDDNNVIDEAVAGTDPKGIDIYRTYVILEKPKPQKKVCDPERADRVYTGCKSLNKWVESPASWY